MKALAEDLIVCEKCGTVAGKFREDVAAEAPIKGGNISLMAKFDDDKHTCLQCHAVVAYYYFREERWTVYTKGRWLQ
jgi:hypothetical protein